MCGASFLLHAKEPDFSEEVGMAFHPPVLRPSLSRDITDSQELSSILLQFFNSF